jgi:hypothetical protein
MEHVPVARVVTVAPVTVQMPVVVEAKVTGSPELAVAVKVTGAADRGTADGPAKVMVWGP